MWDGTGCLFLLSPEYVGHIFCGRHFPKRTFATHQCVNLVFYFLYVFLFCSCDMLSLLELVLHQYLLPAIQLSEVPPTFAYCFNLLPCVSSASFDSIDEGKKNKIFDTFFVSYLVGRVLYRRKKASLSYFSLFLLFFPFFFIRLWYQ